jgi:hypothetical protein
MEAAQHLSLVPPEGFTGEVNRDQLDLLLRQLSERDAEIRELRAEVDRLKAVRTDADLADENAGHLVTLRKQSREIGVLTKRIEVQEDPKSASNALAYEVVDYWRRATRKRGAKIGASRLKLVRARLRDGFEIGEPTGLPEEATLLLALDGLASHPYEIYGKRHRTGNKSARKNDLKDALGDEAKVEACARLGWEARRAGWTLEAGWPPTEETP